MEREGSPLEGGERAALGAQTPRAPRSARPRGARGRVRPGHAAVRSSAPPRRGPRLCFPSAFSTPHSCFSSSAVAG